MMMNKDSDDVVLGREIQRVDRDNITHGFLENFYSLKVNNRDARITSEVC